jgi:copper chaperone NosL
MIVNARTRGDDHPSRRSSLRRAGALLLGALLAACGIAPEPVHIGSDECAQCRMTISEPQFATQVLSNRGRSFKFDSIECMVAFVNGGELPASDMHSAWVADFDSHDDWIAAEDAFFVHSASLRSPMGGGLSAHATRAGADALIAELGTGAVLDWSQLRSRNVTHRHDGESAMRSGAAMAVEGNHAH